MMKKLLLILGALCTLWAQTETIDIVKNAEGLSTISVVCVDGGGVGAERLARMQKALQFDLEVGGLFSVVDKEAAADYRLTVTVKGEGSALSFATDLSGLAKAAGSYTLADGRKALFALHRIAAQVGTAAGGKAASWMEELLLLTKQTASGQVGVYLADYTLGYQQAVVIGGINVFARWADGSRRRILYTALEGRPTLYEADLYTGQKKRLLASQGMTVCSDVSSDGQKLLVTMAPKGEPNIYLFDRTSRSVKALSDFSGIDLGAVFGPGGEIYFVSDRLGQPDIFRLGSAGHGVEQVVFADGGSLAVQVHRGQLSWLERGNGRASVRVRPLGGGATVSLGSGGAIEAYSWSGDGERLMVLRRDGTVSLIDAQSGRQWTINGHFADIKSMQW